eukprot:4846179-Pleurochrysis_carterae.AAC.2
MDPLQRVDLSSGSRKIEFSYSVRWLHTDVPFEERMNRRARDAHAHAQRPRAAHALHQLERWLRLRVCERRGARARCVRAH